MSVSVTITNNDPNVDVHYKYDIHVHHVDDAKVRGYGRCIRPGQSVTFEVERVSGLLVTNGASTRVAPDGVVSYEPT